jgi:hypothetical protein
MISGFTIKLQNIGIRIKMARFEYTMNKEEYDKYQELCDAHKDLETHFYEEVQKEIKLYSFFGGVVIGMIATIIVFLWVLIIQGII